MFVSLRHSLKFALIPLSFIFCHNADAQQLSIGYIQPISNETSYGAVIAFRMPVGKSPFLGEAGVHYSSTGPYKMTGAKLGVSSFFRHEQALHPFYHLGVSLNRMHNRFSERTNPNNIAAIFGTGARFNIDKKRMIELRLSAFLGITPHSTVFNGDHHGNTWVEDVFLQGGAITLSYVWTPSARTSGD